ncbi:bacillithiol biosynthesis deacetylase BshB1 [Aliifodinibius sp. S!AR15-10]|uniref:bacillithiol biosynthesis deacetylase BshB1 n=1 Tax=Aliifodinibius sp. S!AR15-10 TaxID=2950437 RepID=UPI0028632C9B|nr:bacillithiol biosynthesis deacetylase BshB1 [Aliifodinibius sp. S!AR15-10]MDR8390123.1 bacillithiol biosynthesis deacetylase BshB1 [Aliifodinibius sp. S!AR15-10]
MAKQKLDILALAAHPDDTELCCGGTLAKLVQQGKKVGVLDLTQGEMATRGTPEDRLQESQNAADLLGLEVRKNLGLPDTRLENTREYQKQIIQVVRAYRPHVCFVGAPTDRHPDHGDATTLVLDALFYSGLTKIKTQDDEGNKQQRWRPSHILHYMQDQPFEPDLVFDISDTFELKKKAVLAFETQFHVKNPGDDPESYISSERFFKNIEARARHYGHMIGAEYGEPFKYYNGPIPFTSFGELFDSDPFR